MRDRKNPNKWHSISNALYNLTAVLSADTPLVMYHLRAGIVKDPVLPLGFTDTYQDYKKANEYFPFRAWKFLKKFCPREVELFFIEKLEDGYRFGFITP